MVACTAQETTSDLTEITVVLDWTPNTNHTGLYVAQSLGYYEEAGLDVTIIQPPEDGASVLVASNSAQFGVSCQDSLAATYLSDSPLPVTTVATIIQHNTSGILSLAGNGMDTPSGMEGKTYATWDMPVEKAMIRDIVESDGGNFDEITLVPSTVTDVITALQTDIDAVWIYYAWDGVAAEVQGIETDYLDFGEILPEFDFYTPVIIASDEFLASNPEQAKAFLSATAKGYEYSIENSDEAAGILLEAAPELDSDLVYASQEYLATRYKAEVEQWGYIDTARWDGFFNWLVENELAEGEMTSGLGFTNEFLS
ncbi:MAG: ABC transporter substrate-binding protein [Clostridia bacterium]